MLELTEWIVRVGVSKASCGAQWWDSWRWPLRCSFRRGGGCPLDHGQTAWVGRESLPARCLLSDGRSLRRLRHQQPDRQVDRPDRRLGGVGLPLRRGGPWPNTDEWPTQGISGKQIKGISCPYCRGSASASSTRETSIRPPTRPGRPRRGTRSRSMARGATRTSSGSPARPSPSAWRSQAGAGTKARSSPRPTRPAGWRRGNSIELGEAFEFRAVSLPHRFPLRGGGERRPHRHLDRTAG